MLLHPWNLTLLALALPGSLVLPDVGGSLAVSASATPPQAEHSFRLAQASAEPVPQAIRQSVTLRRQGREAHFRGEFELARQTLQQALEQAQSQSDPFLEANAWLAIAELETTLSNRPDATEAANAALERYQMLEDLRGAALTLRILGVLEAEVDLAKGQSLLETALTQAQTANAAITQGLILVNLAGLAIDQQNELERGLQSVEQAKPLLAEAVADPEEELLRQYFQPYLLIYKGTAQVKQNQADEAIATFQQAIALSQAQDSPAPHISAQSRLGATYYRANGEAGQRAKEQTAAQNLEAAKAEIEVAAAAGQQAIAAAAAALEQAKPLGLEKLTADLSGNLHRFYQRWSGTAIQQIEILGDLGQSDKAVAVAEAALAENQRHIERLQLLGDETAIAESRATAALTSMGVSFVQDNAGQFTDSIQSNQAAREIAQGIEASFLEYLGIQNSAIGYLSIHHQAIQQKEFETALESSKLALQQAEEGLNFLDREVAEIQNSPLLSDGLLINTEEKRVKNWRSALLNYWNSAMAVRTSYFNQAQYQPAIEFTQKALFAARELENKNFELQGLQVLAAAQLQLGQFDAALQSAQQAKEIAIDLEMPEEKLSLSIIIGRVYDDTGRYPQAISTYQEALQLADSLGNRYKRGTIQNNLAATYAAQGNYQQSVALYQGRLQDLEELSTLVSQTRNRDELRPACNTSNMKNSSNSALRQRLFDYAKRSCVDQVRYAQATTLNNLSLRYSDLGRYQEALQAGNDALEIAKQLQDPQAEGLYLSNLGTIYHAQGDYPQALEFGQAAQNIQTNIEDEINLATTLNNLGLIYSLQGQYDLAMAQYERSLQLSQSADLKPQLPTVLGNIGTVYEDWGDYTQAEDYYRQALGIAQQLNQPQDQAQQLLRLSYLAELRGDFSQTVALSEQALLLYEAISNPQGVIFARIKQGDILAEQGQFADSLATYQQALDQARAIGARDDIAYALRALGTTSLSLGDYKRAEASYRQALAIFQDIGSTPLQASAYHLLGTVFSAQNQDQEALPLYQKALELYQNSGVLFGQALALSRIGAAQAELQNLDAAQRSLEQSLTIDRRIGNRLNQSSSLTRLANVKAQQSQTEEALQLLNQSLSLNQELGQRPEEALALRTLGEVLAAQGQPELAIAFYKRAVNTYETLRSGLTRLEQDTQQSYTNRIAETYRALADLLLQQGRTIEALQVLDLLKVQELQDFFKDENAIDNETTRIELLPQEEAILTNFEALRTTRSLSNFFAAPAIQQLVKSLQDNAADDNLKLAAYDDLQHRLKALGPNTALFYPLILEGRIELVVLTPDRPPISQPVAISQRELQTKIQAFSDAISNPTSNIKPIARDLYKLLIEPIETELEAADTQTLVYAPDGQMRYVPLAALHDGKQWLTERYELNYLTALALTPLTPASHAQPKVLAGAVTQPHEVEIFDETYSFAGLNFTLPEVETLASRFGATQLIDGDFSREQFQRQMPNHNVLHLATHAKFIPGHPEASFILMGDGKTISLREIDDWQLSGVELMVLSACETALGQRLGNGLEILGFGYQMQRTGARASLASLWAIDDGGTQIFMNSFYGALDQDMTMTKAKAIQAAQQAFISGNYTNVGGSPKRGLGPKNQNSSLPTESKLSHPYYWAPFILIGNGL